MHRSHALAAVALALGLAVGPTIGAPAAGAISGGAGATGSGDTIISTILSGATGGRRPTQAPAAHAPVCSWRTLTDREVLFVIHVAASMPELLDAALIDAVEEILDRQVVPIATIPPSTLPPTRVPPTRVTSTSIPASTHPSTTVTSAGGPPDTFPGLPPAPVLWDIQVQFCDGVAQTDRVRSVVSAITGDDAAAVARNLLTRQSERRLPPPTVAVSPPPDTPAVIGEPVFLSLAAPRPEAAIRDSITASGRVVEVWASPSALAVASGEPDDSGVERCSGFGRLFDPAPTAPSAGVQSREPDACVLRYSHVTGVDLRREAWLGYAQLDWDAWYRVDGGPALPLDGLFSYSLFTRAVRPVDTAIEG